MARQTINIKFPFQETFDGGVFATNTTSENAIKDDLISLLTTKPRQRVMNANLFSPIYNFISEPLDSVLQGRLTSDIIQKVSQFIPQIVIKGITYTANENLLGIKIVFSITNLFNTTQTVSLNIPMDLTNNNTNGN